MESYNPETDLNLDSLMNPALEDASKGQRFANLIIDVIMIYIVIFIIGVILAFAGSSMTTFLAGNLRLAGYVLFGGSSIAYYTVMEGLLGGRTVGKLITGTKVTGLDGQPATVGQAFLRSLSRLVPLESLSALWGTPWHDQWTSTQVVKTK